jgi:CheY-like chemotaxis protein
MSQPSILIVDDEADLRDAIAFDFQRKKFRVLTAASGNEAWEILQKESVNVVLSDVKMPNGSGVQLLDRVKERNAFMPVVILISGFAEISLEEAYEKGADAVFAKPFDRKTLFDTVNRSIQPLNQEIFRRNTRVEVDLSVQLQFLDSKFSLSSRIANLGRGGFFIPLASQFPALGEKVDFRFETGFAPAVLIAGQGEVRWVRKEGRDGLPAGCGIEIVRLVPECVSSMVNLINFEKTKSYIPMK